MPSKWISALPADWREHKDGAEILVKSLVSDALTGNAASLLPYIDIGFELLDVRLPEGAVVIARVIAERLQGPLTETSASDPTDRSLLAVAVEQLRNRPDDELLASLFSLVGSVDRYWQGFDMAAAAYQKSAEMFERLGLRFKAAATRQSQGAALFYAGRTQEAEKATWQAAAVFAELGESTRVAEAMLNVAEYAMAEDDVDKSEAALAAARQALSGRRNGQLRASILSQEAMIDIALDRTKAARAKLLRALASTRRRDDPGMERVILQNLGVLSQETRGPDQAQKWFDLAVDAAQRERDPWAEIEIRNASARNLTELGRWREARALFGDAADLCDRLGDSSGAAHARANVAAAQLSEAIEISSERSRRIRIRKAIDALVAAHGRLEEFGDLDWAARVARNLRTGWSLLPELERGIPYFDSRAERWRGSQPIYAGSLLRQAGLLAFASQKDSQGGVARFAEAAKLVHDSAQARGNALAQDAVSIDNLFGDSESAIALYDLAAGYLLAEEDQVYYGNVLNDSGRLLALDNKYGQALERLALADQIAQRTSNRVLGALVEGNLGEIALRGRNAQEAREHFLVSARLSEALGDLEDASTSWSSIANSYLVQDQPDLLQAADAAQRSVRLAEQSRSSDALARSLSSRASIAWTEQNYEEAFGLWLQAAELIPIPARAEYRAFALDALAVQGDWRRFNRQLEKFARESQKAHANVMFSRELFRPASRWLTKGSVYRAGKTLAYAALLAVDGYSTSDNYRYEDAVARSNAALTGVGGVLYAIDLFLDREDLPADLRQRLKHEFETQVRKVIGDEDGKVLIRTIGRVADWVRRDKSP